MIVSARDRERTRQEINIYSRSLMLSTGVAELCATEAIPKQEEFLHRVLSEEMARRDPNRKTRLLNRAGFPVVKSFAEYDLSGIRFAPALTRAELWSQTHLAPPPHFRCIVGLNDHRQAQKQSRPDLGCLLERALCTCWLHGMKRAVHASS